MPNYYQRLLELAERDGPVKWEKHLPGPRTEDAIQQICARLDIEYVPDQPNNGREAAVRRIYIYAEIGVNLIMKQKEFTSLFKSKRGRKKKIILLETEPVRLYLYFNFLQAKAAKAGLKISDAALAEELASDLKKDASNLKSQVSRGRRKIAQHRGRVAK